MKKGIKYIDLLNYHFKSIFNGIYETILEMDVLMENTMIINF
jgi:hypothetical protein